MPYFSHTHSKIDAFLQLCKCVYTKLAVEKIAFTGGRSAPRPRVAGLPLSRSQKLSLTPPGRAEEDADEEDTVEP